MKTVEILLLIAGVFAIIGICASMLGLGSAIMALLTSIFGG